MSGIFALTISLCAHSIAQESTNPASVTPELGAAEMVTESVPVPQVTLNVENGDMAQVLKAFSLQTGKSIVIGPEVVSSNVNVHLSEVDWNDALEVILKPYGYGYTTTGKAIVVNRLDKIALVKAVEPLESKVFTLHYLDASDIKETIEKHLSTRGNMSVLQRKGLIGWKSDASKGRGNSRSGTSTMGIRERAVTGEDTQKSKTFIITDIPSVLASVEQILMEVDLRPQQVLIEAQFMEVNVNYLRDIGVDFTRLDVGDFTFSSEFSAVAPNAFNPAAELSGGSSRQVFSQLKLDSSDAEIFLRVLQEDDDSNLLSAPKIMTLNNHEATIVVGTKFPIIESDTSGDSTSVTSTSLEYYENIGIQLNVVPQVCAENQINMIVHPSVSEQTGETAGVTGVTSAVTSYPIISVREVETQILLNDGETVVIGGLMSQRDGKSVFKIPLLGDIPILGRLFRRNVDSTKNVELLIFLKANIIDQDNYASHSSAQMEALQSKRIKEMQAVKDAEIAAKKAARLAEKEAEEAAELEAANAEEAAKIAAKDAKIAAKEAKKAAKVAAKEAKEAEEIVAETPADELVMPAVEDAAPEMEMQMEETE
jgi:type IV pilus secretin PilQ/predicted competence protein